MNASTTMIEVDRINAYYGDSHVLFDLSLQVREREVVALLGRNGAGKSTTLKTLAGVLHPRTGAIRFAGEAIEFAAEPRYRQTRSATGAGGAANFRRIDGRRKSGPRRPVGTPGVAAQRDFRDLFPPTRTARQLWPVVVWRRAANAGDRARFDQTSLFILLDEPFEGLAVIIVQNLLEVCRTLAAQGQTIVIVEQNVRAALSLASRTYVSTMGTSCSRALLSNCTKRRMCDELRTLGV